MRRELPAHCYRMVGSVEAEDLASQRARARLDEVAPSPESVVEPVEPHARDLSRQYYERNTDQMFPVVILEGVPGATSSGIGM